MLDVISRVAFRTGIVEPKLLELISKTRCQIIATVDGSSEDTALRRSKIWKAQANLHTWTLSVDSSNAPKPPPDAPPSPTRKKRSTEDITIAVKLNFKIGEDFILTLPITGEKINVGLLEDYYYISILWYRQPNIDFRPTSLINFIITLHTFTVQDETKCKE